MRRRRKHAGMQCAGNETLVRRSPVPLSILQLLHTSSTVITRVKTLWSYSLSLPACLAITSLSGRLPAEVNNRPCHKLFSKRLSMHLLLLQLPMYTSILAGGRRAVNSITS